MTDPIANLLTVIRNAYLAKRDTASVPYSKILENLCKIIAGNHYIKSFTVTGEGPSKKITLEMIYLPSGKGVLSGIKRVSHPSVRNYVAATDINRSLSGSGIAIISTSKGLMTHREARTAGLGGEVICQVW